MDDAKLGAELWSAVRDGLRAAVKDRLSSQYNSPLGKVLDGIVEAHTPELKDLLIGAVATAVFDPAFRAEVQAALRLKLAKVLVERFGGELEKQVNTLKSDPATRARITLAIEEIVRAGK